MPEIDFSKIPSEVHEIVARTRDGGIEIGEFLRKLEPFDLLHVVRITLLARAYSLPFGKAKEIYNEAMFGDQAHVDEAINQILDTFGNESDET